MDIERLEQNIRYTFKNKELLKTALTHTSYAHEKKVESNEKLEFLGDSILEFVTSNYLYNDYYDSGKINNDKFMKYKEMNYEEFSKIFKEINLNNKSILIMKPKNKEE